MTQHGTTPPCDGVHCHLVGTLSYRDFFSVFFHLLLVIILARKDRMAVATRGACSMCTK